MNVHEYQAKALLRERGVDALLPGRVAYTAEEAEAAARELPGGPVYAVKAQIHAGGRRKGGGIRLARSPTEVGQIAGAMLGMTLVTPQTGPAGRQVRRVYVEQGCEVARELYLSLLVDHATSRVTVIASAEGGGAEIGAVAAGTAAEQALTLAIDPATGFEPFHGRRVAAALGLPGGGPQARRAVDLLAGLYRAFTELDASLLEVDPLAVTRDGALVVLDVKLVLDDSALFRHPEVAQLRDHDEEDPHEIEAARHELNYVKLDGDIGCMVNGAGLAMATMDIVKLSGGEPASFLDVGGGATRDRMTVAFRLLLSDPQVEGVLVNVFGGIVRCDAIAEAIVAAVREINVNLPLVVRLEGTNAELGRQILADSGLAITSADDLGDAARKIVALVREAG